MAITEKEIAKLLGLSNTAISMALNNKPGVSTKTRNLVIKTARDNGFDFTKLSDKLEKPLEICIVIYATNNAILSYKPIVNDVIDNLIMNLKNNNCNTRILYYHEKIDDLEMFLNNLQNNDTDGIIILGTQLSVYDAKMFVKLDIPTVIMDTYLPNIDTTFVLINNQNSTYIATNYLIAVKQSMPGILKSNVPLYNFSEREKGFKNALIDNGYPIHKCIEHNVSPTIEGAYCDVLDIINQGETLAKCYFADNDLIAIGAIKAFKEKGYKIPEDISIIGFDNIHDCQIIEPNLTTIDVPRKFMAKTAAQEIVDLIKNHITNYKKIEISASLIKRNSV